jgi:predicted glycosyltransferase
VRVLFDLNHPAHVHLFRNLIHRVQREGGSVLVASRDKDVTVDLCRAYGISHVVLSRSRPGRRSAAGVEMAWRTAQLTAMALRFRPDVLVGTSLSIGPIGMLLRRPSFVFNADDAAVVPLFARFAYPFCSYVVTPEALREETHGAKHLTYPGYHELAYLHPNHFTPDPAVPRGLGLDPSQPYFVLRLVALGGHHDAGATGMPIDAVRRLVSRLAEHGRVLITSEGSLLPEFEPLRFPLPPEKLHDVLAGAALYVGDSQTMAREAAVLGVPSLRCNSFVGRLRVLEELERRDRLTRGFRPDQSADLLRLVDDWCLDLDAVKVEMRYRRASMLARCVDLAEWQWTAISSPRSVPLSLPART